jgi:hypothetical protein
MTSKAKAKYYREIEYVLLSDLPESQRSKIHTVLADEFIKILVDGRIIGPCLQYKHYESWYQDHYPLREHELLRETLSLEKLVLEKAY